MFYNILLVAGHFSQLAMAYYCHISVQENPLHLQKVIIVDKHCVLCILYSATLIFSTLRNIIFRSNDALAKEFDANHNMYENHFSLHRKGISKFCLSPLNKENVNLYVCGSIISSSPVYIFNMKK